MIKTLTLSWRRSLSFRNQSFDLLCKSVDWFLYNRDLRHERVNNSFHCEIKKIQYITALAIKVVIRDTSKEKLDEKLSFETLQQIKEYRESSLLI